MFRNAARRLRITAVVVLSLLFSQLALASYVCPGEEDVAAMAQMMAAGVPCEGMDPTLPVPCHQHFADAAQSSESAKLPALTAPAVLQVLLVPLQLEPVQVNDRPRGNLSEARPPPDP